MVMSFVCVKAHISFPYFINNHTPVNLTARLQEKDRPAAKSETN